MNDITHFVRVDFHRFKAFERFTLHLRNFNILVGPNNAGKSTILAAFRILAAAMRKATSRNPELVPGPRGRRFGYSVDLRTISVAEENIFFNYDESEPAIVSFKLSNGNELLLFFPAKGVCSLLADSQTRQIKGTAAFRSQFNCPIGFVPILGPVEHNEELYQKEAARLALFSYRAARNFRNIWHHYPQRFTEFRELLKSTWPGMDIEPPVIDHSHGKPHLFMFCPEGRIPREIFWAGFGFQVWCQMLTHLLQSGNQCSLFLIDEPDIYLHSDLQRQLLGLLRNLGADILLATHSTEIITEAEPDEIMVVNKNRSAAKRIKHPSELAEVFSVLGSNLNPILTQLAKTRRALFVEGKDFQILGRFARKLAVVPIEGFNPQRARSLKDGMETTLGSKIAAIAILDRDYRCEGERHEIMSECSSFCDLASIHARKEIENFLLVPSALERAIKQRLADHSKRGGKTVVFEERAAAMLEEISSGMKSYVTAQLLANRRRFERINSPNKHEATVAEEALGEIEQQWRTLEGRLAILSGKEVFSAFNRKLQSACGISITPTGVIDAMKRDEIPADMVTLIGNITDVVSSASSTEARETNVVVAAE
jgi:hypothetical protein